MTRSERLAAWFASDAAGWLNASMDEVAEATPRIYDDESFSERFCVVERLELTAEHAVIASTHERIEDAADLRAGPPTTCRGREAESLNRAARYRLAGHVGSARAAALRARYWRNAPVLP